MSTILLEQVRRHANFNIHGEANISSARESMSEQSLTGGLSFVDEEEARKQASIRKMSSIQTLVTTCVSAFRDPLAEIQEKRGISKHQQMTFVELMSALLNQSYNSCFCIITMILGLLPLLEGFLNLLRFVLDKILEINECKTGKEKIIKTTVFVGQLIILAIIVSLVTSIVILPVYHLVEYCALKIWCLVR